MDTVTERDMASAMSQEGGMGVVHRFVEPEDQARIVEGIDPVAGAVGLEEYDRCRNLVDAGIDMIIADIAHGHHKSFIKFIQDIKDRFDVPVAAGNVCTSQGVKDLSDAGADIVKVGVGPGAACTTREMTGAGVPQLSAIQDSNIDDVQVIADGGIRKPGDMVKALMAGADSVMVGSILSDTYESARGGKFRGMSTKAAAEDRPGREMKESDSYEEGETMERSEKRSVKQVIHEYVGGLKSGISYCGASNIHQARENSEFVRISQSTKFRNGAHGSSYEKPD
jgi:IMP dehydrogenase/GMP reductase